METHAEGYGKNPHLRCEECGKAFTREKNLRSHLRRIHENGGQRYVCDHCGKEKMGFTIYQGQTNASHLTLINEFYRKTDDRSFGDSSSKLMENLWMTFTMILKVDLTHQ
nr:unnamed protein product [Callosobruchus analis]